MYTTHTMHHMLTHTQSHYILAVPLSGTSWSWCVHFPSLLSGGERLVAVEGSQPLWDRGLGGKLLLGRRRVSQGWQKHFSLVRQNIVQALCTYVEAVKQQIIHTKRWIILMVLCCSYIRSKAETFIHVAIQNFIMRVLYTELRITGQICLEIHCFNIMSRHLSYIDEFNLSPCLRCPNWSPWSSTL